MGKITDQKGLLGEIAVEKDLISKNYVIFRPLGETTSVDMIAMDKSYNLYKIQVKYCTPRKGLCLLTLEAGTFNINRNCKKRYKGIDIYAIYNPKEDQCYYVSEKEVEKYKTTFSIRVEKPMKKFESINYSSNYKEFPPCS